MADIMLNLVTTDDCGPPVKKKKHNRSLKFKLKRKGQQKQTWAQGEPGPGPPGPGPRDVASPSASCSHKKTPQKGRGSSSTNTLPYMSVSEKKPDASSAPHSTANTKMSATSACKTSAPAGLPTKYLAIDCEMVGSGPKGHISQLARCSIVSFHGDVIYDKFIRPAVPVTDYRTRWSGIRSKDLRNAMPYCDARKEILRLLMGKVVIGHAIHNDFKALGYAHPPALTRDTSRIPLLNAKAGFAAHEVASLKRLTKAIFDRDIQTGRRGHSSVEDAKATMELYKLVEEEWESRLASTP